MRMIATTALAWGLATSPAYAQAQASTAEPEAPLGDIVVTAERRETRLQTTPIAVTAIGAQQLADQRIDQTIDLGKVVPNLQLLPLTANPSSFQISLRGGSEQTGGLVTSESAVSVYVDDVYRGRLAGSNFELADVERVEVLRGPQGTLYGRNAFSGAINVVTRKPRDVLYATAGASYGRFDEGRVFGTVGGPVADGLGAAISAVYRKRGDGFINNIALGRRVGREESFATRGTLNYFGAERLSATLALSYTKDNNDGFNPIPVTYANPNAAVVSTLQAIPLVGFYANQTPTPAFGRTKQFAATLDLGYDLGAARLRSISAYIHTNDAFRFDLGGGVRTPTGFASFFDRTSFARSRQFSQELQLQGGSNADVLSYILGLYYFSEDSTQTLSDVFSGFPLIPTRLDVNSKSYAAFAQGNLKLGQRLRATAGIRYTRDDKRLDGTIQSGFVPLITAVNVRRGDRFTAWTPKLGLDFKASDVVFIYASVSRGFKAGGYNGLAVADPLVLNSVYQPQTVWAYELGAKFTSSDRRLRASVSFFRNELKNLQQTATIAPFSFAVQNVGDARVDGMETEVTWQPIDALTLSGNVGFMDDRYRRLAPSSQAAASGATRLPLLSRWSYQLAARLDSGTRIAGIRLKAGAEYKSFSNYFASENNSLLVNGYGRLDGSIAVATPDDRIELSLSGRNLANRRNFVSGSSTTALTVALPRTWLLGARWRL